MSPQIASFFKFSDNINALPFSPRTIYFSAQPILRDLILYNWRKLQVMYLINYATCPHSLHIIHITCQCSSQYPVLNYYIYNSRFPDIRFHILRPNLPSIQSLPKDLSGRLRLSEREAVQVLVSNAEFMELEF